MADGGFVVEVAERRCRRREGEEAGSAEGGVHRRRGGRVEAWRRGGLETRRRGVDEECRMRGARGLRVVMLRVAAWA